MKKKLLITALLCMIMVFAIDVTAFADGEGGEQSVEEAPTQAEEIINNNIPNGERERERAP